MLSAGKKSKFKVKVTLSGRAFVKHTRLQRSSVTYEKSNKYKDMRQLLFKLYLDQQNTWFKYKIINIINSKTKLVAAYIRGIA